MNYPLNTDEQKYATDRVNAVVTTACDATAIQPSCDYLATVVRPSCNFHATPLRRSLGSRTISRKSHASRIAVASHAVATTALADQGAEAGATPVRSPFSSFSLLPSSPFPSPLIPLSRGLGSVSSRQKRILDHVDF